MSWCWGTAPLPTADPSEAQVFLHDQFGLFITPFTYLTSNMEVDLDGIFTQNGTINYDDYVYTEECPSLDATSVFLPCVYALALVLGLPGLVLLLALLIRMGRRRRLRVMDVVALHLAVADGLLLGTLPFWSAQAGHPSGWSFGTPFCKISGALFNVGTPAVCLYIID